MDKHVALDSAWQINDKIAKYVSNKEFLGDYQRLIFDQVFRDGEISVDITIRKSFRPLDELRIESNLDAKVGSVIFRFQNPSNYYVAGLGAYGHKYYLSRIVDGRQKLLATRGQSEEVHLDETYSVSVRCYGNRISLLHNNVIVLDTFDGTFSAGQWGLQTYRSHAEFNHVKSGGTKPTCFVIMPFAGEFNEVYEVIRQTVNFHDFDCIRADERYLSGPIVNDINDQIEKADLIVADLTGKNPNVFYEVGYAAALRKSVIQIAQSADDLPFDVRHRRTFAYSTRILGDRKLASDLTKAIQAIV